MSSTGRSAVQIGAGFALLAACLFGVSTPLLRHFHAGPFVTASLLYTGAALASLPHRGVSSDTPIRIRNTPRIVAAALSGAVIAPACLAWGLSRTTATVGSLLLASEAFFTVALAALFYREPIGKRLGAALALITLASMVLVRGAGSASLGGLAGALAVMAACAAWALDNTIARPLADLDARQVVIAKSLMGALLSVAIALGFGETAPPYAVALGLIATGGLGYGVSLRCYLLAQRRIGAARTGSIFATAPFVGALAAWLTGQGEIDRSTVLAGCLVALGLYLQLRETHGHEHAHDAMDHEHAHRHDDGHHAHAHDPPVTGEHSHPHRHTPLRHTHPHGQDLHHRHGH